MVRAKKNPQGSLRIIAGQFRGRRLVVADLDGLRPTTDRIRETVFNWLAPYIEGARCLDLFAGSGGLGLEAISRGAVQVCFLENHPLAIEALKQNINQLVSDERATVLKVDTLHWLKETSTSGSKKQSFDIVFIDPPFSSEFYQVIFDSLISSKLLAGNALIYVESDKQRHLNIPQSWECLREKIAGQVRYALYRYSLS